MIFVTDKERYNKLASEVTPDELLLERTKNAMTNLKKASVLRYVAVAAAFVFVLAAVLIIPKLGDNASSAVAGPGEGSTELSSEGEIYPAQSTSEFVRITNEFDFDGAHYIRAYVCGITETCTAQQLGEKLGTITQSIDGDMIGLGVWEYADGQGRALLAVENGEGYELYAFTGFLDYNNNGEADASRYLSMFGISSAEDVSRISLVRFDPDNAEAAPTEVTDKTKIQSFLNAFAPLKADAAGYFSAIENYGEPAPSMETVSTEGGAYTPGYEGNHALDVCVVTEIYNNDGMCISMPLYSNIGYFSRMAADADFIALVNSLVDAQ